MSNINIEACKKAGFDFHEIEDIKQGILDKENGRVSDENEVFDRLNKKISSNLTINV